MTWPTCLTCQKAYVPVPALHGCPWCSGTPQLAETPRERKTRLERARYRARHNLS